MSERSDITEICEWLSDITETLETLTEQMKGLTDYLNVLAEEDAEGNQDGYINANSITYNNSVGIYGG